MKRYELLLEQIKSIIDPSLPLYSNLANVSAILNEMENINWCGFYIANKDELLLGPFQGEPACTRIKIGRGVCGTSFQKKETIIVDNVLKFDGHIACSSKSRSEIVSPIIKDNIVVAVIDIDSPILSRFTTEEKDFLEEVAKQLNKLF